MSYRNPKTLGVWGEEGTRVLASDSMWAQPLLWNREAEKVGVRARVFSYSLGDVFERPWKKENLAVCEAARARLFALIERTPWLDWLLLTKRPENIMGMVPEPWRAGLPSNVWVGTSVENQAAADERIPHLLKVPARVRFLSMEPLLEAVSLDVVFGLKPGNVWRECLCNKIAKRDRPCLTCEARASLGEKSGINWVIVGGESGPGARPFDLAWARSIRDQCKAAGVPFFMKQTGTQPRHRLGDGLLYPYPLKLDRKGGDPSEWPADLRVQEFPQ